MTKNNNLQRFPALVIQLFICYLKSIVKTMLFVPRTCVEYKLTDAVWTICRNCVDGCKPFVLMWGSRAMNLSMPLCHQVYFPGNG